jgi:hypothetical protein
MGWVTWSAARRINFYREFIESWQASRHDPATGLPRTNDLEEASEKALRAAALGLAMEMAGRIEPKKSWLTRWAGELPKGHILAMDLFPGAKEPHQQWLDALRRAITGKQFNNLHRYLRLTDENLRQCFAEGDVCNALGPSLADGFLEWARFELPSHTEHPELESLVRDGWIVTEKDQRPRRIMFAQVYGAFFLEHLKRNPKVFRVLVADTLAAMRKQLDAQGASATAELRSLREKLDSLPPISVKIDFFAFEQWLENADAFQPTLAKSLV